MVIIIHLLIIFVLLLMAGGALTDWLNGEGNHFLLISILAFGVGVLNIFILTSCVLVHCN